MIYKKNKAYWGIIIAFFTFLIIFLLSLLIFFIKVNTSIKPVSIISFVVITLYILFYWRFVKPITFEFEITQSELIIKKFLRKDIIQLNEIKDMAFEIYHLQPFQRAPIIRINTKSAKSYILELGGFIDTIGLINSLEKINGKSIAPEKLKNALASGDVKEIMKANMELNFKGKL